MAVKYVVIKPGIDKPVAGVFDTKALAEDAILKAGYRYNKDQDLFTKEAGFDTLVRWIVSVSYNELDLSNGKE